MKTLIAARKRLAERIAKAMVHGERYIVTEARDSVELRHKIHKANLRSSPVTEVILDDEFAETWDPLDVLPRLSLMAPYPRAVVLTAEDAPEIRHRALSRGAFEVVARHRGWEQRLSVALARALVAQRQIAADASSLVEERRRGPSLRH